MLHQARVGQRPHDAHGEDDNNHQGQEKLEHRQGEQTRQTAGQERVGDHHSEQPNAGACHLGHTGAAPFPRGLYLHYGQVSVHTDAGEEEDAAVHIDKVTEDVDIGAVEAFPTTVVQYDTCGQRQVDQKVRDGQVDGVDDRGGLGLGTKKEDIKGKGVEDHSHHENKGVDDHQSNPQAVEVIVESFIKVGQAIQVGFPGDFGAITGDRGTQGCREVCGRSPLSRGHPHANAAGSVFDQKHIQNIEKIPLIIGYVGLMTIEVHMSLVIQLLETLTQRWSHKVTLSTTVSEECFHYSENK